MDCSVRYVADGLAALSAGDDEKVTAAYLRYRVKWDAVRLLAGPTDDLSGPRRCLRMWSDRTVRRGPRAPSDASPPKVFRLGRGSAKIIPRDKSPQGR